MLNSYIGTRDFLPSVWSNLQYIFNTWRKVSESYGFREYEAPIICPLELFTDKSGEEIKNQLFWFKDKGDRDVCLRAELTPQLARYMIEYGKGLKKPIKWYSIPRLFRYEKPQRGRLREFFQYNADIIGEESVLATAEIIELSIKVLTSFGLTKEDFVIKINSRKIIDALIKRLSVMDKPSFYTLVDKRDKMEEKEFKTELKKLVKEYDLLIELFELEGSDLLTKLDELGVETKRVKDLKKLINNEFVELDLSIVRGLAYYTDIVFEAVDKKGELRSILGGGEYNNLIKEFGGEETPAVGFGIGDTVLLELLKSKNLLPSKERNIIFIATIGNVISEAFKLRDYLIKKGESVDLNLTDRNLSKQLSYADSKGIKTVYILGEKELKNNTITIKNLKTGKEKKINKKF